MNSSSSTPILVALTLAAVSLFGADPAPKLVPRALPGLGVVQLAPPAPDTVTPAPESVTQVPDSKAPAVPVDPESQNRARILFIHRRAALPPHMTADLAKPSSASKEKAVASQGVFLRPGKVRIISKSDVTALLAAPAEPKPAQP